MSWKSRFVFDDMRETFGDAEIDREIWHVFRDLNYELRLVIRWLIDGHVCITNLRKSWSFMVTKVLF